MLNGLFHSVQYRNPSWLLQNKKRSTELNVSFVDVLIYCQGVQAPDSHANA